MGISNKYQAETEARDFTAPSGYLFRVLGMTKVDFARLLGGLPSIASGLDREGLTAAERQKNEQLERAVYDEFVLGVVDPESGVPELVPYEKVLVGDMDPLIAFAMNRGGLGTAKADAIRGAL